MGTEILIETETHSSNIGNGFGTFIAKDHVKPSKTLLLMDPMTWLKWE